MSKAQNEHTAELFTKHAEQTKERTKLLLSQHVEAQQQFTKSALGKFAEQVEAKFETQDARIDYLEAGANKDQNAIEQLKLRMVWQTVRPTKPSKPSCCRWQMPMAALMG